MRAVIIGLLGAAFICGFTYFNDCVLRQSLLISDHMPVIIYGGLILFLVFLNPLLKRLQAKAALNSRELAVILMLILASCTIPAFGLMRTFTNSLMLPHYHSLRQPAWREHDIVAAAPAKMLTDISKDENETLTAFVQGMSVGDDHISLRQVPWYAWTRALAFWLPGILALWIGCIALAVVVHPQWAHHEQLPYPIAKFADALLGAADGDGKSIFRNKLFLIGCFTVLSFYVWNYVQGWFHFLVPIRQTIDFRALSPLVPTFVRGGGTRLLLFRLRFMPIAFAFFLASDVALSLGIGPYLWCLIVGMFLAHGIPLEGGGYLSLKISSFMNFGAYLGFFLAILFWGRHYYLSVFRRALGLRGGDEVDKQYVWSARGFMVCALLFVLWLMSAQLDWQLAVLYAAGAFIIFLVMGRITAETGMFFLQVWTFPCVVLWGLMGPAALGPETLLIMFLITCVILLDPREALLPYMVNSIQLLDLNNVKIGRHATWCIAAIVLGLCVAIPVTLYFQYDRGLSTTDGWTQLAAGFPFENAVKIKQELLVQGRLDESQEVRGFRRFTRIHAGGSYVWGFAAGLVLVLVFAAGRVRFSKWPLHPVMFLVWGTFPAWRFAPCFLIGWFVKVMVVKYGGSHQYRKTQPLMMGLIAGEILGFLFGVLVGLGYYFWTGTPPKYSVWR